MDVVLPNLVQQFFLLIYHHLFAIIPVLHAIFVQIAAIRIEWNEPVAEHPEDVVPMVH